MDTQPQRDILGIAAHFNRAADLLEKGKVIAGLLYNGEGGYCALGALDKTNLGDVNTWEKIGRHSADVLAEELDLPAPKDNYNFYFIHSRSRIAAWSNNTVDAGCPEKVIEGFRKAARQLMCRH